MDPLEIFAFVRSNNCRHSIIETISCLNADDQSTISHGSDGVSSGVEQPPLAVICRVVVSNPESVLLSSNILAPENSSVSLHLRLDLELHSVLEWLLWIANTFPV